MNSPEEESQTVPPGSGPEDSGGTIPGMLECLTLAHKGLVTIARRHPCRILLFLVLVSVLANLPGWIGFPAELQTISQVVLALLTGLILGTQGLLQQMRGQNQSETPELQTKLQGPWGSGVSQLQ